MCQKEFCEEHSSTAPLLLLLLLLLGRGEGIFSGGLQLQKCRSDKWYTNSNRPRLLKNFWSGVKIY